MSMRLLGRLSLQTQDYENSRAFTVFEHMTIKTYKHSSFQLSWTWTITGIRGRKPFQHYLPCKLSGVYPVQTSDHLVSLRNEESGWSFSFTWHSLSKMRSGLRCFACTATSLWACLIPRQLPYTLGTDGILVEPLDVWGGHMPHMSLTI